MRFDTVRLVALLALAFFMISIASEAQPQAKVWRIGLFHVGLDHVPASLDGLRERLKALVQVPIEKGRKNWQCGC